MNDDQLQALLSEIRACRVCADDLPHAPRPVLRASPTARLCIVGQAPGTRVHETGIPWNDRSGDRLRGWLELDRATFYDQGRIAIVPIGFCYPGRDRHGGDRPPRRECAPLWQASVRALMPDLVLTLLVGSYAQHFYLGDRCRRTASETIRAWEAFGPAFLPLPHPSWRNNGWLRRHPWFESDLLPELRRRVQALV